MNGLARTGWCVNYLMESKIANYRFKDGEAKKNTNYLDLFAKLFSFKKWRNQTSY